jgi:hypothetical protein
VSPTAPALPGRLLRLDPSHAGRALPPGDAARRVRAALAAEGGGVLLSPSPGARAILAELPASVPVATVLPDMAQLLRDAGDRGAVRAALDRLGRGGIAAWGRVGVTGLRHLRALARQDMEGIIPVLLELERASLGGVELRAIVLAVPLTDLLLAAGHRACFAHLVRFVRRRMRVQIGLETHNLGHLLTRLEAWRVAPDFVIGPINPRGFRMKPSPSAVLETVRRAWVPTFASDLSAGDTVPLETGIAHARAHGAAGIVLALDELAAGGLPERGADR